MASIKQAMRCHAPAAIATLLIAGYGLEILKYPKAFAQYPCGSWQDIGLQTAWDMRDGF
ncbi:hypothetical protein [Undibacterium sp.]|uniref:hypothetical protein n=1 Tax=Undibacterium sp. TaxID=1914977 RepID=UPI0025F7DB42|nr:hypothetical protein [Undibacterium sp.]